MNYRVLLNYQAVYLRGLPVAPDYEPLPGFEVSGSQPDSEFLQVAKFLYQNGFAKVREKDPAGWSPLHYAALRGDVSLMAGMLAQRADPNAQTRSDQPRVGVPPFTPALSICLFYKHNDAARLLISARASINIGFIRPAITSAADANNPEGIRILCEAGCSPHARNMFGISAFESACACASFSAMQELLNQASHNVDATSALFCAMLHRGGSADLVNWLVELRADVNGSRSVWKHSKAFGVLTAVKSLQHRYGRASACTKSLHHVPGATPLMLAMNTSQYEAVAALIAAGARIDLRNKRGWTVADFAEGQSLPGFLTEALEGNSAECQRLTKVVCRDSYVEDVF